MLARDTCHGGSSVAGPVLGSRDAERVTQGGGGSGQSMLMESTPKVQEEAAFFWYDCASIHENPIGFLSPSFLPASSADTQTHSTHRAPCHPRGGGNTL